MIWKSCVAPKKAFPKQKHCLDKPKSKKGIPKKCKCYRFQVSFRYWGL